MRAAVLRAFGPPERISVEELPDPEPGPGQVVVSVEIASVTFVETQVRAGTPPNPALIPQLPVVLGNGVGGVIVRIGDGADRSLVGRRVITTTGGSGGYAEKVAVDATGLIDVPPTLELADAVALLADGRTALGLVELALVRAGEKILVEAAAGGVGGLLVQLARDAGATVVGAAGGPSKASFVRKLGANMAVDYRNTTWSGDVRAQFGALDVVFDGVGGQIGRTSLELLGPGGRFVCFGMASGAFTEIPRDESERCGIEILRPPARTPSELADLTRRALAYAAAGRLQVVIGQTYPLDRVADAHASIEERATVGKTLLLISPATARKTR